MILILAMVLFHIHHDIFIIQILEGHIASPTDEQWFEAPVTGTELQSVESRGTRMSTTHQEFVEAENARDATIRELEQFLVEFRNGKLRSCKI